MCVGTGGGGDIEYHLMAVNEAEKLRQIDRSEVVDDIYYFRSGKLVLEKEHYDMRGFPPGELDNIIERQKILIYDGGTLMGAFHGGELVAAASLENKFRGKQKKCMKMDILFVSRPYRGRGIARRLVGMIGDLARERGADALYISATPSKHTVEFYMGCGAKLVEELDAELYGMEPEDIHLELVL